MNAEDVKRRLEGNTDALTHLLLNPPNAKSSITMITHTEKLFISAVSGLFANTISEQDDLDEAYCMIDSLIEETRGHMRHTLFLIAQHEDLKPKYVTDVNVATHNEIMKELGKKNGS